MKALVITGSESFEIRECEKPVPGEGQCLIEVLGNTMCNQHDVSVFSGGHSNSYPLETGFPGHEGVGRVAECGSGITDFAPGDLVAMTGYGGDPLYAQFVNREIGTFFKVAVSDDYSIPALAALELFACVEHGLKKADPYGEASVAVAGLGAAGLTALQLLRARGIKNITGIDIMPERFERARECGASDCLDANQFSDYTAALSEAAGAYFTGQEPVKPKANLVPEKQFDIIIECSGSPWSTATSFALARDTVIMFGVCRTIIPVVQWTWFNSELTILNAKMLDNADLKTVADYASAGTIDPRLLVTHTFSFTEYDQAIAAVKRGEVIKGVLTWN